jgi:uncharacterized membrane protein
VNSYEWLLTFHMTGAFLFFGGAIAAGVLNTLALRAERPSDIALLLRLIQVTVVAIGVGGFLSLILGVWLVHHVGYSYGAFWIWAALVLWVIAGALGGRGGRRQAKARELAEQLDASGQGSTEELRAVLRDPLGNALSYGAGIAILLILVLMIWKPGS